DDLRLRHHRLIGAAVGRLDPLRLGLGNLQAVDQIAGHMPAGEPECGRVPELATLKDGDRGAPGAKLDQDHPGVALFGAQDGERRRQRFENELAYMPAGLLDRLPLVRQRARAHGHEVYLGLDPLTRHADTVAVTRLAVDAI